MSHTETFDENIEEVVLELRRIDVEEPFYADALINADIDVFCDRLRGRIMYKLKGFMVSEEDREEVVVYPSDWWNAFKERWFPEWLQKKFPVEYRRKRFSFQVLYPDFKPKLPVQRHIIKMQKIDSVFNR